MVLMYSASNLGFALDFEVHEPESDATIMYHTYNFPLTNYQEVKVLPNFTLQTRNPIIEPKNISHPYFDPIATFTFTIPPAIKPLKPWKPAVAGTAEKYAGILSKVIPELANISPEKIDEALEEIRYKD